MLVTVHVHAANVAQGFPGHIIARRPQSPAYNHDICCLLYTSPLYFFSFVGSIGVSCATETFTIPLLTALAFGIYYTSVIRKEQERLTARFGDAYRNYCRNVQMCIRDRIMSIHCTPLSQTGSG